MADERPKDARGAEPEASKQQAWVKLKKRLFTGKKRLPTFTRLEDEIAERKHDLEDAKDAVDDCYEGVFNLDDADEDPEGAVARLDASHKARIDAANAKCRTLGAELAVLERLLKWRTETAPPRSVRTVSDGGVDTNRRRH